MADLVLSEVVAPAAKWTLKKLWQELGYMCCYKSNIGDLNERAQQLLDKRDEVNLDVKPAREALQPIGPGVDRWLGDVDKIKTAKEMNFSEQSVAAKAACCYGWLPNLKGRFSLGRNAKKMALAVDQLLAKDVGNIAHPAPHPEVEFQPTEDSTPLGTHFQEGASSSGTSYHEHSTHPTQHSTHLGTHFHEGASSSGTSNHEHSTHLGTHFHEGASSSGTSNHEQPLTSEGKNIYFDSRKSTFEDVMEALRGNQINPIIICGMGGIGKTTLMGQVHEKAKKEGLFDEYTKASIKESLQNEAPDLNVIQDELARFLGLPLDGKETDARASQLRDRLSQGSKNILVMLDNVWTTSPDFLWDIGIPRGCKLLVTSRQQDLFKNMDTRKNFPIDGLPDREAWSLFKKRAGSSIGSDPELHVVAEKILKKCAGLPIAISTVGTALKDESIGIWKNALKELEKANPENVPGVIQHVYGKIKLSYEWLPNEQLKSCFLLCCIFEESADIRIEDLVRYGHGLELFKGIDSMAEVRNRVETLVSTLKSRFLLLDCDEKGCVRMHDVVRDVAVYITSEEFVEKNDDRVEKRIVVRDTVETLNMRDCPISEQPAVCRSLSIGGRCVLLRLRARVSERQLRMEDIKVLAVEGLYLSLLLPSLAVMKNLQTLRLQEYSWDGEGEFEVSVIGEMRTLKILSLRGCWGLRKLPDTFKNLSDLRLLDLSECENLKVISPGVISSLTRLEELYMLECSYEWISDKLASTETTNWISQMEAKAEQESVGSREREDLEEIVETWRELNRLAVEQPAKVGKVGKRFRTEVQDSDRPYFFTLWVNSMEWETGILAELLCLTRLTSLQVVLPPLNVLLTSTLFNKLERFIISFGWTRQPLNLGRIDGNYLRVDYIDESAVVGNGITCLLKITSFLELRTVTETQLVNVLDTVCFTKIKHFNLNIHDDAEYLIDTTCLKPTASHGSNAIFPLLSSLEIIGNRRSESRLKDIFHGELPTGSMKELRSLKLNRLRTLTHIWKIYSPSEWGVLRNIIGLLQVLDIRGCNSLEAIVAFEYENEEVINFRCLTALTLEHATNFAGISKIISKGPERLPEHSSPEQSEVITQPLFNTEVHFPVLTMLQISYFEFKEIWNNQLPAESFCQLKSLEVSRCEKLLHLVPMHMQNRLHKLESIQVGDCSSLKEIFEFRRLIVGDEGDAAALTNSESGNEGMQINKMMSFKQSHQAFQNLKVLLVWDCNRLRTLLSPSIARGLVKLQSLNIHHCANIEEIVAAAAPGEEETEDENMFPQLHTLELRHLPNLGSFSQGKHNYEWPLVTYVDISDCPNMKKFCLGSLSLPKEVQIFGLGAGESLLQELNNSRKEI